MPDVSFVQLIILEFLVLAVSTAVGVVAFGFAMTMTPFLLIFLEPRLVVEMNIVLTSVLFASMVTLSWKHIKLGTLIALLIGGVFGIPLGVMFTKTLSHEVLGLMLSAVVITTALFAMFGKFRRFSNDKIPAALVGGVFSFLNAALSLGGPILAVFALNQRWSRDQTRAMLSSCFLVTGVAVLISHVMVGLLGTKELISAAVFLPPLIIGSLIASILVRYVNETLFRKLVLGVLLVTSFGLLSREIYQMI